MCCTACIPHCRAIGGMEIRRCAGKKDGAGLDRANRPADDGTVPDGERNAAQMDVDRQFTADDAGTKSRHLYPILSI